MNLGIGIDLSLEAEAKRERLGELLDEPVSVGNLTDIAEVLAGGLIPIKRGEGITFFRSGCVALLMARARAHGLDPEQFVSIIDAVPSEFGGIGYEAANNRSMERA